MQTAFTPKIMYVNWNVFTGWPFPERPATPESVLACQASATSAIRYAFNIDSGSFGVIIRPTMTEANITLNLDRRGKDGSDFAKISRRENGDASILHKIDPENAADFYPMFEIVMHWCQHRYEARTQTPVEKVTPDKGRNHVKEPTYKAPEAPAKGVQAALMTLLKAADPSTNNADVEEALRKSADLREAVEAALALESEVKADEDAAAEEVARKMRGRTKPKQEKRKGRKGKSKPANESKPATTSKPTSKPTTKPASKPASIASLSGGDLLAAIAKAKA